MGWEREEFGASPLRMAVASTVILAATLFALLVAEATVPATVLLFAAGAAAALMGWLQMRTTAWLGLLAYTVVSAAASITLHVFAPLPLDAGAPWLAPAQYPPLAAAATVALLSAWLWWRPGGAGEDRFRLLGENIPGVLYLCQNDERYRMRYINKSVLELTGYSAGQFLRDEISFADLYLPEDHDRVRASVDAALARRAPFHIEYRIRRKDGECRWVEEFGAGVYRGGKLLYLEGLLNDITARKLAEQALIESEERLRTIAEQNLVGVYIVQANRVVYVNEACAAMAGYTVDEALQWDEFGFMGLIHPDDRSLVVDQFRRKLEGGATASQYDVRVLHRNGGIRWLTVLSNAISYRGAPAVFGVLMDITDRKRMEEALSAGEATLRLFVEHTPAAVAMLDRDMRYLVASRRWYVDYRLDDKDIIGKCHYDVFPEIPERWKEIHRRCLAGVYEKCDQDPFERADGTTDWVRWEIYPWRDAAGGIGGIVMFTEVITERVRAEAERRELELRFQQTQKLESLGIMAGGIAHDFNNLLMGVLGNADLALHEPGLGESMRDHLEAIQRAALRAAELSRQMLAYSGKGRFQVETISLNELMREMASLIEASVPKHIPLRWRLGEPLPAVKVDATQVRQVLMNLVTNAAEAIGDGEGTITVTTSARYCGHDVFRGAVVDEERDPGVFVCLEVADTGCGMDPEHIRRAFDPFFTTKFTGRGLGLATVLGIVRGHKGVLTVDSQPGAGTKFRALFPAAAETPVSVAVPNQPASVWRGSGKVLLVDDEEAVRAVAKDMLAWAGFEVLAAAGGREAVEIFEQCKNEIRCVVLDLTMPDMDGVKTFHALMRIRNGVPVLLSSGYAEQSASQRFAGEAYAGFIQKPYQLATLTEKLRAALEGR